MFFLVSAFRLVLSFSFLAPPVSFSGINSKRLLASLVTLNFNFYPSRLCTSFLALPDTLRITLLSTSFTLSNSCFSAHPLLFLPQIFVCASPIQGFVRHDKRRVTSTNTNTN